MTDKTLLPPSATDPERHIELATARLADVPVLIRDAWNPDTCPVELLPWLAWAFSVDEWQDGWSEQAKRDVIKNSLYVHKHKGTLAALRRAVAPLGYIIRIVEWFQESPPGIPYTFRLEVGVNEHGIDETIYEQIERLVQTYKNVRSQMLALAIKGEVKGKVHFASALLTGEETTVFPFQQTDQQVVGGLYIAIAMQDVAETTVYPHGWSPYPKFARITDTGAARVTDADKARSLWN